MEVDEKIEKGDVVRETAGRGNDVRVCRDARQEKRDKKRYSTGQQEMDDREQDKKRVNSEADVDRNTGQDEEVTLQSKAIY